MNNINAEISPTNRSRGDLGENIASRYLIGKGFRIIERNYLRKYGEIDIVCSKDNILHFIEVKAVSRLTSDFDSDRFRPEDNVHKSKLLRLSRVFEVYISENSITTDWQFDVLTVILDKDRKTATIKVLRDIVIGT